MLELERVHKFVLTRTWDFYRNVRDTANFVPAEPFAAPTRWGKYQHNLRELSSILA